MFTFDPCPQTEVEPQLLLYTFVRRGVGALWGDLDPANVINFQCIFSVSPLEID